MPLGILPDGRLFYSYDNVLRNSLRRTPCGPTRAPRPPTGRERSNPTLHKAYPPLALDMSARIMPVRRGQHFPRTGHGWQICQVCQRKEFIRCLFVFLPTPGQLSMTVSRAVRSLTFASYRYPANWTCLRMRRRPSLIPWLLWLLDYQKLSR